jgi:hypothetical protein
VQFFKDLSWSSFTAGFVAVLVGFTSSIAIVFQAAQAFGATPEMLASWLWAISIGMGLTTAVPSLWLRKPVMVAWSTPGAAVLASAGLAGGFSMGDAVGAFMASAALVVLVGATGWFERVMNRIPVALASALLAGVLARARKDHPFHVAHGIHVLLSQTAKGELTIGDSHEYGLTLSPFDREDINGAIMSYLKTFAHAPDLSIAERWHGVYPKMTNGQSECILKPEPGVVLVNGLGGAGMTMSFGLAEETLQNF